MIFLIVKLVVTKRSSYILTRILHKIFLSVSSYTSIHTWVCDHILYNQYYASNDRILWLRKGLATHFLDWNILWSLGNMISFKTSSWAYGVSPDFVRNVYVSYWLGWIIINRFWKEKSAANFKKNKQTWKLDFFAVLWFRFLLPWELSVEATFNSQRAFSLRTARRPNQSILKEIHPEYSLEGLMLKLQYSGHQMRRADSLETTLMLGKTEGRRRRGWQRMGWGWCHWLNGHESEENPGDGDGQGALVCCSP